MMMKRVKFLDPGEIDATVAEVAKAAEGSEMALIGGVAMMLYGSDRMTKDVDVAACIIPPSLVPVKRLSVGGSVCKTPGGRLVDVVVREDDYMALYQEAIFHAHDLGLPLLVVEPEYLAVLKMAAAREKDVLDLKTLIGLGVLDVSRLVKIVREHLGVYAVREPKSVFAEVEWEKSRDV